MGSQEASRSPRPPLAAFPSPDAWLTGLNGAVLLRAQSDTFVRVTPWMLLLAALAIALGTRLGPMPRTRMRSNLPTIPAVLAIARHYGSPAVQESENIAR